MKRALALLALLVIGCGGSDPPGRPDAGDGRFDAGPARDGGAGMDADLVPPEPPPDAGEPLPDGYFYDPPAEPEPLPDPPSEEDPEPIVGKPPPDPPPPEPPPPPPPAPPPTPAECPFVPGAELGLKTVFVDRYPEPDYDIENELIALLRAAMPGSRVRMSIFHLTRTDFADAIIAAYQRGVDVRIVMDEDNQTEDPAGSGSYRWHRAVERLLAPPLAGGLGPERVTICNRGTAPDMPPNGGGCQGPGINHNKFYLFESLCDGSRHVVAQSSANHTAPQLQSHNNMIVIRDDPALFAGYETYWRHLVRQVYVPDYYRTVYGGRRTKAYFFPRRTRDGGDGEEPRTDTIHNVLGNVDCSAGGTIRVAMGLWTEARGTIVDDLRELQDAGCDVKVIAGMDGASAALEDHLERVFPRRHRVTPGVHSKYLLIDARYFGERRRMVFTGSHNYTGPALRENDEALLRIHNRRVYDQYLANWRTIWYSLGGP